MSLHACWSCKGPVEASAFCPTCGAIQPPQRDQSLFEFLGLPPSYGVDPQALEAACLRLQQQFHPDKFATQADTARRYAMEYATRLNEAKQILSAPLQRAIYLLEQLGGTASHASGGGQDPMFLMEVMELRERLEELDAESETVWDKLEALKHEVTALAEEEIAALSSGFAKQDGDPEWWVVLARHIDRLRYHTKFLEEVDRFEERLF
ncbi:co-chaperone Hsc20 [Magnetococcus marinus MC-1]|uniref:Co-chaperone protein HscB homolog n=1 Tax=Magnetococcus marinus (strain ATCC BAA-1437 / JCM 17883 / MC-1) TaxID=156889 RepID=A0LC57_MAGMM|nr:Fe-S protein assembly co-chaperone HscB [Magnetococcus marinus]ABK45550.1 co-chaperone Hsc20 [Magnetococcus marinus MC-1]